MESVTSAIKKSANVIGYLSSVWGSQLRKPENPLGANPNTPEIDRNERNESLSLRPRRIDELQEATPAEVQTELSMRQHRAEAVVPSDLQSGTRIKSKRYQ